MKTDFSLADIYDPTKFLIQTPMMEELSEELHRWLWHGITGGLVLGQYRAGKTGAIRAIMNSLVTRQDQPIPAHYLSFVRRDQSTIASVFRNLCYSLDMKPSRGTTADTMANDLVYQFADMSLLNEQRQIVLFVDEFQRMQLRQLEAFAELYDRLTEIGTNLCVVFIGNTVASTSLIEEIALDINELIRGRFFTRTHNYHGIRNHGELKSCLEEFDKRIKIDGSESSIAQYFVGDKLGPKWQLKSLSREIWHVYNSKYKHKGNIESWGMQYFVSTVKTLLFDYIPDHGIGSEPVIEGIIQESIETSGLVQNLVKLQS
jgi:hypothetical protein